MFVCRLLHFVLLPVICSSMHQAVPVVVPVTTETPEVYECVHSSDPTAANYTWYRQDRPSLPEGIKAEGNRLHFMQSTSDLNGLYICSITNEYGTFVASFYREVQDCPLRRILKKVSALWMLLMQTQSLPS
ncbi:hypothetical protein PGIGA_G00219200 [Pangasianodon gigas]|uniref:Uncharacterized protein n=1 Tax=Pangasianodon gigas TaxID=30993 RepID=A0ACC5WHX5_PANGG|nr:hypothetical protein [Pangasianodon gigas]